VYEFDFESARTHSVEDSTDERNTMPTTWFITGTSSGFGRLLTEQLLARGDRVAATLRQPEALEELSAEHGGRLWLARLDVTSTEQVHRVVDDAFAALGTIDVVINNAGYGVFASVEEAADEQIRRVIDTNLLGSIDVIRAALPHLRAQGHGRILQVSTAGGQTTYPNFGYYHASKWGIEGFCETVAREIAPFGIGLTIVEPGATPTGFGSSLDTAPAMPEYEDTPAGEGRRARAAGAFSRPNDPQKIAAAMIELVDSGAVPLRLPLGSDTYDDVRASLVARLAEHDAHRAAAFSVVRDGLM
jgi:NAD(P)-dependent dehydrogenase (short-subunit alcohol dehydrogenase family)